ncbi:uncharacterized protein LOC129732439 [Wyeomyia smithii]|uniref:uncharacterized protein LOC129732438 n=1 Tax=Wyeomyia smithii TaxID=174621 RepID=UPI002467AE75|nr:uncharacterized protein LOC129732438 [Wyeomyia smithii]XP_055549303.1 uncharacterized protein LOC129732439 [Wyeomyia smithii]
MRALVSFLAAVLLVVEISVAVQLDEVPGNQLQTLEALIGDALVNVGKLETDLQEALSLNRFSNVESVSADVTGLAQKLQGITNTTETLLQHSQYERYRTIIAAIRIINSTCARMAIELERVLPLIVPGTFTYEMLEKTADVKQHLSVGQVLLKRYLAMLIDTS